MTLINKQTTYSPTGQTDRDGRAHEIEDWQIEEARQQASQEGLELTDDHIDVINFLREFYVENGWPQSTHELKQVLDDAFEAKGGNKYLHKLFPDGPVAQGSRLAGVPTPDYAVDSSFGSTY